MEIIIKGTSEEIAMLMNKISSKDLKQVTNSSNSQLGGCTCSTEFNSDPCYEHPTAHLCKKK